MHRRSDRSSGITHLTITGAESLGQVQQMFPSQKETSENKCCRSSRVTCLLCWECWAFTSPPERSGHQEKTGAA